MDRSSIAPRSALANVSASQPSVRAQSAARTVIRSVAEAIKFPPMIGSPDDHERESVDILPAAIADPR
jgi:hypothetical protein